MVATGGHRPEFWASTPREVFFDLDVAAERMARDYETMRWHTWWGAAMPLMKQFPKFNDFVPAKSGASKAKGRQTMDEQIAVVRQWSAISKLMSKSVPAPQRL